MNTTLIHLNSFTTIFDLDLYMALLFDMHCYLTQSFISRHVDSHMTDR
jgi:hypothetical protein